MESARASRLTRLFKDALCGKTRVQAGNANLFLEAIRSQTDPRDCLYQLSSSKNGMDGLQNAMRFNLADTFLNEHASPLLHYFQQPGLAEIGNGQLLQSVLRKIVDPPIFWNPFQQAFLNDTLTLDGQKAFGWLLLQLVSLPPGSSAPYRDDSNFNQHLSRLLSSDDLDLRTLGHKIKHAIQSPRDFYTGPRSPSRSISARPSEETQVFRSPAPPFTAMSATQATASSSNTLTSGSLSDAAMRRRQTAFEIRHIDIEIESAEANLARLQQLRSRLVELLAYDEEDF